MEDSDPKRKVGRPRVRKNASRERDTAEETAVSGPSGVSLAPTAHLADKRKSHELEMCQLKIEMQQEKIDELIKERDFLKEQLSSTLKKDDTGSTVKRLSSGSSSDSSEENSSDTISDSSSQTSSSEEDKKKKKKKKRKKGKEKKSKSHKKEPKARKRAQNPDQVVSGYKKILRLFRGGRTMSACFKRVGVDRNTIVATAPVAELFIAAPTKYKELLKNHSRQVKLSAFAAQCAALIQGNPDIEDTVQTFKVSGKLLPLKSK